MIRTGDLKFRGMSDHAIKQVRARSIRVRRGLYVESVEDDWHGYALLCQAVLLSLSPQAALTGPSAAMLWGLPLIGAPPTRAWVRGATPGRYGKDVKVVSPRLPDVLEIGGLRVVPPAMAIADCARLLGRRAALVMADAALRAGTCNRDELVAIAAACRGMSGVARLRWVAESADGASESPGESWMRMVVRDLGYDVLLQVPVEWGDFHARVDMLLEGSTLILEFDGLAKYENYAEAGKVLQAEKHRQAHLEALGFTVLRVTWEQLSHPQMLDRRIRVALRHVAPV